MENVGKSVVNMNIDELIKLLNKALSDEWFAYYQYWVGSKIVKGPMKESTIAELIQHAADELRHAEMLSVRIIQLGGYPVLSPEDWFKMSNCGYATPNDPYIEKILIQNIEGEQCAIRSYQNLMNITKDKDPVTHNIILQILQDEIEHENDLMSLNEDLEFLLKNVK